MSAGHVVGAVAAVALAAFAIWRRRKLSRERFVLLLLGAVALGIYASGLLSQLPDPKKAIVKVAQALGPWTYALVGVAAYLETAAFIGLIAPGETIVLAGGVIAGQGEISLVPLIGVVWVAAVLGDTTSFFIGRRLGRNFLLRVGPKLRITEERLEQVERYFQRHGGKTILIGRFIGLVRALAPFIAGSSRLPYRRFIPFSVVGTGLWAALFSTLGYIFWRSFDKVANVAGQALLGFSIVVGVIVGTVYAYRRLRQPKERRKLAAWIERQARKPVVGPLFALVLPTWRRLIRPLTQVLAPRLRFLWDRLTPGELGLELTSMLAVGLAGMYGFFLYVVVLSGDRGPTPFDHTFLDLADRLQNGVAVDIAKVVTNLGAFPTVAALVVATCVLLAGRRRPIELVTLVAGLLLTWAAVQLTKAGLDRPRPSGALIDTKGSSFPSGHAAYSTFWVAVAVVITRRLRLFAFTGLVLVALGIAVAVGVTRMYLRAHYFSDVMGGWALGFGIFGTLGAIALVVAYIRDNRASMEASR